MSLLRTIKIILNRDTLNPSTLFNPFLGQHYGTYKLKHSFRWSIWRVFFKNLAYEIFWREWWRDEQQELAKLYQYSKKLEDKIEKEVSMQLKWTRL